MVVPVSKNLEGGKVSVDLRNWSKKAWSSVFSGWVAA
jgi:hypothetical protein